MEEVVIVSGLKKSYKEKTAVQDLSFTIKKGEFFGLLGHNGAGKSTTIECILGTKNMDVGFIRVLGMNPFKHRKQLYQKVGVQFQETNYQDKIKVKEACEVTRALYQNPADEKQLLRIFGLEGMEKKLVAELSGGEKQKLSVLLALIPNPELVFLDELTTGLDSKARRDVWKHLVKLKENGLTILLTSHYMDQVEALCDRVCILKNGEVIAMNTVGELIKNSPYQNFEKAYLWYSGEEETPDEGIYRTI